jgi:glutathione synthase/RimK-type ligase-like ATP-grasp enzyme
MPSRVLIVTNRADLHADIVAPKIAARGGAPFRLNLDEFPACYALQARFEDGACRGELTYLPTDDTLALDDVGAVWMRKRADFRFASDDLAAQELAYAREETEHVVFSLLYSLDCRWMSHPAALRAACWKGEQLLRAARMGFRTAPSLITNRRAGVDRFRSGGRPVVFKSLSSPTLAVERVAPGERLTGGVPTTLITAEHEAVLDAVEELPSFFQAHVAKACELRVTVVGARVLAARIHSQADARTALDYRDGAADILYEPAELPADVEARCRALVASYGLTYGALDLIVTPEGEHVFLENNPGGQFLFVEQLAGIDLSGAVADWLAGHAA